MLKTNEECGIREVWASNLDEEMKRIRHLVWKFPYVAMDTEFPGVVARPIGEFSSTSAYQYQLLRCNVDLLRLIQVGLTFMNENGELPPDYTSWQFNFRFCLSADMYAQDSIELLQQSGIQFSQHQEDGIDPVYFAELMITSGLVLQDDVTWLSFHSGYDFGYLLKLLTDQPLPYEESEFFELLRIYFPKIYDVKYLMKSCRILKGGLQEVADQLEVQRIGPQHQAGSDSLLTGLTFFKMKEMFFEDSMDESRYCGHLYGLGLSYTQTSEVAWEEEHGVITNGNAVNSKAAAASASGDAADKPNCSLGDGGSSSKEKTPVSVDNDDSSMDSNSNSGAGNSSRKLGGKTTYYTNNNSSAKNSAKSSQLSQSDSQSSSACGSESGDLEPGDSSSTRGVESGAGGNNVDGGGSSKSSVISLHSGGADYDSKGGKDDDK